jgi:hypothetical protein
MRRAQPRTGRTRRRLPGARRIAGIGVSLASLIVMCFGALAQPAFADTLSGCKILHGSGTMQLVTTGEFPTPEYGQSLIYQVWGGINTSGCTTGEMELVAYSTSTAWPSSPATCDVGRVPRSGVTRRV